MKGAAGRKVVTSGRLTGGAKVHVARTQVPRNPAPEPAYSPLSTDSEDQVTTLHNGLDRCAALLSGILRAETAASASFPGAKSRPSASLAKKLIKKLPTKTAGQRTSQSGQCGPGSGTTTPRTSHRPPVPAPHSGVRLHPPRKQPRGLVQSHHVSPSFCKTLSPTNPPAQSQPSVLLSVVQSSSRLGQQCVREAAADTVRTCSTECDFVPVRDTNTHSSITDAHMSIGQGTKVAQGRGCKKDVEVKTIQYLLEELKALIGGQGNIAELLLGCLEQAVSSPQVNNGRLSVLAGPVLSSLHNRNTPLPRLHEKQLKEKAEIQQNMATLCHSEVSTRQEELTTAQSRLQELQGYLPELWKALQDTRRQLNDRETESRATKIDLEATRRRWVESEREKRELAALSQQRLEEIENLKRILQSRDSSDSDTNSTVVDLVSDALLNQQQQREHPAGPPTDHISHYLMSLEPLQPTEHVHRATEGKGDTESMHGQLLDSLHSHLAVEYVQCDWSMESESSFNTRDEAAFRDGLAALDASIASLQKTLKLDLRR